MFSLNCVIDCLHSYSTPEAINFGPVAQKAGGIFLARLSPPPMLGSRRGRSELSKVCYAYRISHYGFVDRAVIRLRSSTSLWTSDTRF
jgi:hypothetical protein